MTSDTLTSTDNRTGRNYTLPIENGTIRAMDLREIRTSDEDFGLMAFDPAFTNPASCRIIYQAMGLKPEFYAVLFAIPSSVGRLAQWQEMISDPEQKISRPRQVYTGQRRRRVTPLAERQTAALSPDR